MNNIFLKITLFVAFIGIIVTGCQKEEVNPIEQSDEQTQLTPEQLDLKKKMDQAAQVLVEFSNDKEVLAEVQKMIDMKMYRDDYIKFKDLFQPETNNQLKSFGTTKFAKRFRETVSQRLKSSDDFDLEQFLIDNDLALYVPYPVEDYPEDKQVPTITYHPLDNDSVNIGYRLSTKKSTNQMETVPKVNEDYSKSYPVYIIEPDDEIRGGEDNDPDSGTGTGGGNTGGGNTGNKASVRLEKAQLKKHYEAFFNGGSEVQIVFADGIEYDDQNNPVTVNRHYNAPHYFTRKEVRKKTWIDIKIVLDPNWSVNELRNYFAVVEVDNTGTVTIEPKVELKTKNGTFKASAKFNYTSRNDFIGECEFERDNFMQSQANPTRFGLETYDGLPIRKVGEFSFTTNVIYY